MNGADEKDFSDLLRALATLNARHIPGYPAFAAAYYETSFHWCRKLMRFLCHSQAVNVPHDIVGQFDRTTATLTAYRADARKALVHGDPADFNCGRDTDGHIRFFDFGLSGMDMWLKDIALRLGGSTSPRPLTGDDRHWLAFYLEVKVTDISPALWQELEMTRRICRLYYDETSLRHFIDHPEDPVYREWAGRIVQCITCSKA